MNIKFSEIVENNEYRERIIKFFRLPIRLTVSKEKFLSDLEFIKETDPLKYEVIVSFTEKDFNKLAKEQGTSTPDFSMENILEPLIKDISETEKWQNFISNDIENVLEDFNGIKNTPAFYKKEHDGKHLISIDLRSANWQSLQSIVGFKEGYEELVRKYTDNAIPPISKTFRTKITGVIGAKQIMLYNKKLLHDNKQNILTALKSETGIDLINKDVFAFYADEFLIEIDSNTLTNLQNQDLDELEIKVYNQTGINVHIRPFTLHWLGLEKGCVKMYQDGFEILNLSKDILTVFNKMMVGSEIKEIDFEGIKLKNKTKEQFLNEVEKSIKLVESLKR